MEGSSRDEVDNVDPDDAGSDNAGGLMTGFGSRKFGGGSSEHCRRVMFRRTI